MVMDLPAASSHFADAGGLGRLDLSCWARTTIAATARVSTAKLQIVKSLRMRIPSRGMNVAWKSRRQDVRTRREREWRAAAPKKENIGGREGCHPHPFPKSAEAEENKRVAAILEEPVCAKSAQTIEREEDELLLFAKNAKGWEGGGGEMANSDIGNPDGYQKKGVRGEAKRIVVKTKGIAKLAQI